MPNKKEEVLGTESHVGESTAHHLRFSAEGVVLRKEQIPGLYSLIRMSEIWIMLPYSEATTGCLMQESLDQVSEERGTGAERNERGLS